MSGEQIFFEQIRSAGCLSYILGCAKEKVCVAIDPELDKADEYLGLVAFLERKFFTPSTRIPTPITTRRAKSCASDSE